MSQSRAESAPPSRPTLGIGFDWKRFVRATLVPRGKAPKGESAGALPTSNESNASHSDPPTGPPTVILVGGTGVGKSSVINMILGDDQAKVSSSLKGCTRGWHRYTTSAGHREVHLYDTAGLNEPKTGNIPSPQAVQQLNQLLKELTTGVTLIMFVMKAERISSHEENNYRLIRLLCGPDVPVAVIFTRADGLDDGGESWWTEASKELQEREWCFVDSAVIAASPGYKNRCQDLHEASQRKISALITRHIDHTHLYSYVIHSSDAVEKILNAISLMVKEVRIGKRSTDGLHAELQELLRKDYAMTWGSATNVAADQSGRVQKVLSEVQGV